MIRKEETVERVETKSTVERFFDALPLEKKKKVLSEQMLMVYDEMRYALREKDVTSLRDLCNFYLKIERELRDLEEK